MTDCLKQHNFVRFTVWIKVKEYIVARYGFNIPQMQIKSTNCSTHAKYKPKTRTNFR